LFALTEDHVCAFESHVAGTPGEYLEMALFHATKKGMLSQNGFK
jgi:hypothetical protein